MSYVSKRKPREHQAKALEALKGKKAFAVLMAMRTGKTKVIADDFGRLVSEGVIRDLLVIAPAGAYMPWADALRADIPDYILSITKIFTFVSSARNNKLVRNELEAFVKYEGPRVLLMNSEALSSVSEARWLCEKFLLASAGRNMCVIDESVVIKNPTSILGKFCVDKLAPLAEYRRILSGLVSPRSPIDVYQQFKFLNKDLFPEKYSAFKIRHTIYKRITFLRIQQVEAKYRHVYNIPKEVPVKLTKDEMTEAIFKAGRYIPSIPIVKGYKELERITDIVAANSFRVRLEDCFDMPEADYSFCDVPLTPEQEKAYSEMRDFFSSTQEDEVISASTVVTQMLKLHQIVCGHTISEEGKNIFFPQNRTKALVDILSDYDGKAIIWAAYDVNVKAITEALREAFGKNSVSRFWGDNRSSRENEEREFKEIPERRFMVATPDAGGRGRTWDNADLVIYYSCRNNLDHRAQSEERAKNVGKMRPVTYIDMRTPGTVEEKIIDALRKKIDLAALIASDPVVTNWVI